MFFDAHCDTVQRINDYGGSLEKNNYQLDLERISNLNEDYIQIFAAFINRKKDRNTPFLRCNELIDCYFENINKNSGVIAHCGSVKDIYNNLSQHKICALLSIEGGEALEGKLENLYWFYRRGVRLITLTWNYSNELCGGIGELSGSGLTLFGKSVVAEMNSIGMVIDVSHISEKGFWNVIETTTKPVVASHSNVKSICDNKRNLDDKQICAIIKNEGCIGINFYADFLSNEKCTVKDILLHIEHILALGGENNIGLGSDFDGIDKLPEGINSVEGLYKVVNEMSRAGYSDSLIDKILAKNHLNFIKKVIN